MSTAINTGGPAFPSDENINTRDGMTLRDYFAATWLGTIVIHPGGGVAPELIAADCYRMADAMLAARQGGAA